MSAAGTIETPLGPIAVEANERGVSGITFRAHGGASSSSVQRVPGPQSPVRDLEEAHLRRGIAALRDYFEGRVPQLPSLDLGGSAFDRKVWSALLGIPWGETITYGELAARIGVPGAARAVGAANGRNPAAILVPCHRVVAAGGALGGYAGGVEVKRWLLAHEARAPSR